MKNLIITLLAVFATATSAMADRVVKEFTMHVNTADGQTVDYEFKDEPTFTFNGGELTIEAWSQETVKLVMDNVTNVTFSYKEVEAGVGNSVPVGAPVSVAATADGVEMGGLKPNTKVVVSDASGRQVAVAYADAGGKVTLAMRNYGKGVFVVSTPGNTFKFIK